MIFFARLNPRILVIDMYMLYIHTHFHFVNTHSTSFKHLSKYRLNNKMELLNSSLAFNGKLLHLNEQIRNIEDSIGTFDNCK